MPAIRRLRLGPTAIAGLLLLGCPAPQTCPETAAPTAPTETSAAPTAEPAATLASWNDTQTRAAIEGFVAEAVDPDSDGFVPEADRIAVFDNDGTLWVEQPLYTQLAFALDRVRELAPEHPQWKKAPPMSHVIAGDKEAMAKFGMEDLLTIVGVTHGGISTETYMAAVAGWLGEARHPRFDRPYTQLVYQPMVELLAYLRANGFKTYIVSGGGIDFMRVFAEETYGIPPEQVIGSSLATRYAADSREIVREGKLFFIDDGPGKPVAIDRHIGRRPVIAVGNSDGDFDMLEWSTSGPRPGLGIYVHHTDEAREFAYDRKSHVGKLDRGLTAAPERGWIVVDMKSDWKVVFSPQ
jgi:phosphoglycolate phosphatase-like HAD superfamily hydrolase